MDINKFKIELLSYLSVFEFVEDIEINQKDTTIRIKVFLKNQIRLNIFYNKHLKVQSFALIENNNRIWGLDNDKRLGWHEHTIANPDFHKKVKNHTIKEIIEKCNKILLNY